MEQLSKNTEKIVGMIVKLEPQEFIGVCKILGVVIYDEVEGEANVDDAAGRPCTDIDDNGSQTDETVAARPVHIEVRSAEKLIVDVIEKVEKLNRTQRRNLLKLLKPATKGR